MKRKLQENKKKGFTLVELIVVLVILAILAALLIPALVGYIDKAKEKQIIAETRSCVMAAQTLADEKYAEDAGNLTSDATSNGNVQTLADVPGTVNNFTVEGGKVTLLKYTNDGLTCTYKYDTTTKKGAYSKPGPATP